MQQSFPGQQGEPAPSRAGHAAVARDHESGPGRTLFLAGRPGNCTSTPVHPDDAPRTPVTPIRQRPHASRGAVPAGQPAPGPSTIAEAGPLSFCLDYLALQPTSSVNDGPVTRS